MARIEARTNVGTGEEQFRAVQSEIRAVSGTTPSGRILFDRYGRFRGDTKALGDLQAFHRSTGTQIALDAGGYARARRPDGGLGHLVSPSQIVTNRQLASGNELIIRGGQAIDPISGKSLYSVSQSSLLAKHTQHLSLIHI